MTVYPLAALRALLLHTQLLDRPAEATPPPSLDFDVPGCRPPRRGPDRHAADGRPRHYWRSGPASGRMILRTSTPFLRAGTQIFRGLASCRLLTFPCHGIAISFRASAKPGTAVNRYGQDLVIDARQPPNDWCRDRAHRARAVRCEPAISKPGHPRGSWWDWKPAKCALEYARPVRRSDDR